MGSGGNGAGKGGLMCNDKAPHLKSPFLAKYLFLDPVIARDLSSTLYP
jgi:hypothetical protein